MGDLFTNGKNYRGKTSLDEFKVTIPENPLLLKQAVTSKSDRPQTEWPLMIEIN